MSTTPNAKGTHAKAATPEYALLRKEATVTIALTYAGCERTLPVQTFTQVHLHTHKPLTAPGVIFVGDIDLFREVCADMVRLCEQNDALETEVAALRAELATRQDSHAAPESQAQP